MHRLPKLLRLSLQLNIVPRDRIMPVSPYACLILNPPWIRMTTCCASAWCGLRKSMTVGKPILFQFDQRINGIQDG